MIKCAVLHAFNRRITVKDCYCKLIIYRPLGYERVYLPIYKVADTLSHIQGGRYMHGSRWTSMLRQL